MTATRSVDVEARERPLVPTARQGATGAGESYHVPAPMLRPPEPEKSRWQRFKGVVVDLDPRRVPGPKLPLVVFGFMSLLTRWDDEALGLIGPELRAEFGLSVQTLASMASVIGIVAVMLALPLGFFVDRVKRVRLVQFSAVTRNLSSVGQALSGSAGQLYGARAVSAVSGLVYQPAVLPLISDYYPPSARARVLGFLAACQRLGEILGLPVAGYLIVRWGWRSAVFAIAMVTTVASLLTFLLREPKRGAAERLEAGQDPETEPEAAPGWREAIRAAWAVRTLRRQAYAEGLQAVAIGPSGILISLVLAEKFFLDPAGRAWLLTIQAAAALPAYLLGGALADRVIKRRPSNVVVAQASLSFVAAGTLVALAFLESLPVFAAVTVFSSVLSSALLPSTRTIISLVAPPRVRGVSFQISAPFLVVGMAVAPAIVATVQGLSLQQGLLFFVPFYLATGMVTLSSAATVASDMRAARAAAAAGAASKRTGDSGHGSPLLVCRDLEVSVGPVTLVQSVDLDLGPGECLALLGTNGAGKSTLLRAIAGIQQASNGAVFVDGRDATHAPAHENAKHGIVMLPGGEAVFPSLTVHENIVLVASIAGISSEEALADAVNLFPELRARMTTRAGDMSGGEQQMLAIAQVALMRPRLLLVDELSLGLAPSAVDRAVEVVRSVVASGSSVVVVEQSINVALTLAERAVFMDRGAIEFDGATSELLSRPDLLRAVFLAGGGSAAAPKARRRSPGEQAQQVVRCEGVSVRYGGIRAVDDVSLSIAAGEIVGVIGPNGAGKSTLLDALSGHTPVSGGRVLLGTDDVTSLPPDARARLGLGRTFQNARLFPSLTVREVITLAYERHAAKSALLAALWAPSVRRSERSLARRVDGLLEILALTGYASSFVRELSTGTRRAVELATIMAQEPRVVLLDEPSSGLAQAESEGLGPALQRLVQETGCGLFVIEHDLPLIASISDQLVALDAGRVVTSGSPADVMSDERVVAGYLAASGQALGRSGSGMDKVAEMLGLQTRRST